MTCVSHDLTDIIMAMKVQVTVKSGLIMCVCVCVWREGDGGLIQKNTAPMMLTFKIVKYIK